MAVGEPAVDEPVVREEDAVAESCVVGFVRHGELRLDWQNFHPRTSADGGAGSVGDFGTGVDVGIGVEAVVRKLHQQGDWQVMVLSDPRKENSSTPYLRK